MNGSTSSILSSRTLARAVVGALRIRLARTSPKVRPG
jgi:hypothetical protein